MAAKVDRSKYRNPDIPVGYVKSEPELRYVHGVEIDGVHYVWAPYLYEVNVDERDDKDELSDLGFMSNSEDDIRDDEEITVQNKKKVIKDTGTKELSLPSNIKKEKEDIAIKNGPNEKDEKKVPKHRKKGHDSSDTAALNDYLSNMDIDTTKHEKRKKSKKIKKEYKIDYRSDSNSPPPSGYRYHRSPSKSKRHSPTSRSKHHSPTSRTKHHSPSSSHRYSPSDLYEKLVTYSSSPSSSPERYLGVKIKEEPVEQPLHLFGHYHCDICNITMNSLLTYNTHINGKRHLKNLKMKNVPEIVAQSIPASAVSEDQSRYPKPPPGVIRKKVQTPAVVQQVIEKSITQPCPGLNFVTEIQGLAGVQYYCSLCDSVCSSSSILAHLTGFKHQLKSVKEFKPGAYEEMKNEPKYKIEKEVQNILYAIERKQGKSRMVVEIEELAPISEDWKHRTSEPSTSNDYLSQPSTSRDHQSQPSTSRDHQSRSRRDYPSHSSSSRGSSRDHAESFHERYDRATIPDTSASDFYCKLCQSHMNSFQMWEAHVRGKRHLTNLKKMPGDVPSKTKTIAVAGRRAHLLDRIKKECPNEPFVGLNEVRETEIHETKSHNYQCFLCGSCHTSIDILDHLISLKHRSKYLDHYEFPGREVIAGMSDSAAYSLVRDMCVQIEEEEGSGNPAVHVNKSMLFK